MKRLQNLGMVDGDDRNDMEDMENIEHQGEDEDHMLTTMEKKSQKENERRKNQEDVDRNYGNS
jgi:hypothetical protein